MDKFYKVVTTSVIFGFFGGGICGKEGETEQLQASERESSPETMPSTAEEVYVPRTRDIQQSGRRHEVESKRVESVEKVEEGSFKSKVGEFKFWAFLKSM